MKAMWNWAGVVLLAGCAALAALLELTFVPYHVGSVLAPVSVLFSLVGNHVFPRLARAFVDSTAAMVTPFAVWLLVMIVLALTTRPEGDVFVQAGNNEQWVYYGALLGGAVVAVATIVLRPVTRPR